MIIASQIIGVRSDKLHRKLSERIRVFENTFPDYPIRHQAMSDEAKKYYCGYEIPEMKAAYEKWSGKTLSEPDNWFPAYCRLHHVLGLIDLNQKEIPLIDNKKHMFLNDLEFLCYADITKLLTKQQVFDLLGIDLAVAPET